MVFENFFRKMSIGKKEELIGEIVKQTENGFWLVRIEKNEKGQLIYERKREFKNSSDPKEDEVAYDYEKRFEYDDKGNLIKEEGRSYDHENGWKKTFEWEEGKMISENGEITHGPSKGHTWVKRFERDDSGNVLTEEGEILAQGINPSKEPKGHAWRKKCFYKDGSWIGERGEITDGPEKGKTWIKGKVPEED